MIDGISSVLVEIPLEAIDVASRLTAVSATLHKNLLDQVGILDGYEALTGNDVSTTLPDIAVLSRLGEESVKDDPSYFKMAKIIVENLSVVSPYKVGIPLTFENSAEALLKGDMQGLFDNSLGLLVLAADYRSNTTGKMVKGLNTLYGEHLAYRAMLTKASAKPNVKPQEILALQDRVSESKRALESKMELANAKTKQQFHQLDKQRGNHDVANSGLKQIKEETPTNIKPISAEIDIIFSKQTQKQAKEWTYSDSPIPLGELFNKAEVYGTFMELKLISQRTLSPDEVVLLPSTLKAEDVQVFTIQDKSGIQKTVKIVTESQQFMNKSFGEGAQSGYSLPRIPNSKDIVTYESTWSKNQSSLTIYMSKDLLKTTGGFLDTLTQTITEIGSLVRHLQESPNGLTHIQLKKLLEKDHKALNKSLVDEVTEIFEKRDSEESATYINIAEGATYGDIAYKVKTNPNSGIGEARYKDVFKDIPMIPQQWAKNIQSGKWQPIEGFREINAPNFIKYLEQNRPDLSQNGGLMILQDIKTPYKTDSGLQPANNYKAELGQASFTITKEGNALEYVLIAPKGTVVLEGSPRALKVEGLVLNIKDGEIVSVSKVDTKGKYSTEFGNNGFFKKMENGTANKVEIFNGYKKVFQIMKTWYQDINFLDSGIKLTASDLPLESSYYRFQNRLELENLQNYVVEKIKERDYQYFKDAASLELEVANKPNQLMSNVPDRLSDGTAVSMEQYIDRIAAELNKGDNSRIILTAPKKLGAADGLYENKLQMVATGNQLKDQVNTLTDSELHTMIQVAKTYWLEAGAVSEALDNINFSIADLALNSSVDTQAIAITQGNNIIIDSTAKGHGWFVDTTPLSHDEYSQDSSGHSYTALTGTDSAERIDLLTVLIHEMGNVLGVSHRQDNDVMTLRINLGERRLPSLEDAQYLAWLNTGLNTNVLNNIDQALSSNDTSQHACFAAGVLVHTDKGLVPIEQLKIGDMVLSAPEDTIPTPNGNLETAYKPVTQVFKSAEKQGVIGPLGNPSIICTANHPFWTKEKGWIKAEDLDYSTYIYQLTPLFDYPHYSSNSFVLGSMHGENQEFISETPFEGVVIGFENNDSFGWNDRWFNGPYIKDLNNVKHEYIRVLSADSFDEELTEQEKSMYIEAVNDVIVTGNYFQYKTIVYNIEVADYHTYFVGESGTWVHNCDPSTINNEFATLNNSEQWQHQGKINTEAAINSVTLVESDTVHTSLRQAFSVNEDNRLLSFTVADSNINNATKQAGDAFEAALLNAQTGEAVTQITDITRTDSLLNIQADGSERVATGVQKVVNTDGTSTYFIDLTSWYQAQVTNGASTDVLLSFDLLGFGDADSKVTIRDIKLSSDPVASNDRYTLAEDTVLTDNVLINDVLAGSGVQTMSVVT